MNYYIYVFQGADKTKWIVRVEYLARLGDFIFDYLPTKIDIIKKYNESNFYPLFPLMDYDNIVLEYNYAI